LFGVIVMIAKYIGRRVEIIYQSTDGRLTQRTIRVLGVQDGVVRAFCVTSRAPRTFRVENILAALPATRRRSA
jgi:predicted DNA-binding transcriptional regulator YafY